MPVDAAGNRADIIMDGGSIVSRMNLGRLYEHYINGAIRDVDNHIRAMLGITEKDPYRASKKVNDLYQKNPDLILRAHQYALDFYEVISKPQFETYRALSTSEILEHITGIVSEGMICYFPSDNEYESPDIIEAIEQRFHPVYGPVSYIGNSGNRVTTKSPVRIAPIYSMLLEKIADGASSVASARLQHFGVLSPITRSEKYSRPWHNSSVRVLGEPEAKIIAGYAGAEAIAEMMDRNNNPLTHRCIVEKLLSSNTPSNIEKAVDRSLIPLGSHKPIMLLKHFGYCAGWELVYEHEDPDVK